MFAFVLATALALASAAPSLPNQYMVSGTITLPYGNITEPFRTYVDLVNNMQVRPVRGASQHWSVCMPYLFLLFKISIMISRASLAAASFLVTVGAQLEPVTVPSDSSPAVFARKRQSTILQRRPYFCFF